MSRWSRRSRFVLPAVLCLGLAVSGCGSSDSDSTSTAASGGSAKKELTIGVSYPTSNSPFWQAYTSFIDDGAKQLGVKVNAVAANENEQKQLDDVQNLLSQGIDGLILTPQSTAIAPALLRAAKQRNVPVVVTDRYPGYEPGTNDKADYVGFLGPNDELAGQNIAEALADAGAKNLLALGGTAGNSVAEGRKKGLEAGAKAKGSTVVQFQAAGDSQEAGLKAAENLLQARKSGVDGFWCFNDNLCQGAIKAAKDGGRSGMKFGGMDLTPEAIKAIESGSYTVSFGGHWLQGGFGLVMLYDAINGKQPKTPIVKLDLLKVDKQNVTAFQDQFIDNPPKYDFEELSQVTNPDATGFFEIALEK